MGGAGILTPEPSPAHDITSQSIARPWNLPRVKGKDRDSRSPVASLFPLHPHLFLRAKGFCLSPGASLGCRKKLAAIHICRTMRPKMMETVRLKHRAGSLRRPSLLFQVLLDAQ